MWFSVGSMTHQVLSELEMKERSPCGRGRHCTKRCNHGSKLTRATTREGSTKGGREERRRLFVDYVFEKTDMHVEVAHEGSVEVNDNV